MIEPTRAKAERSCGTRPSRPAVRVASERYVVLLREASTSAACFLPRPFKAAIACR